VDVERAVGVARVADVFFPGALLQDGDVLAQLRRAIGGDEAGNAGADDDDVVVAHGHNSNILRGVLWMFSILPSGPIRKLSHTVTNSRALPKVGCRPMFMLVPSAISSSWRTIGRSTTS